MNSAEQRANNQHLNAIYHAIADPTRRQLMELLENRELSITALAKHFSISRVAVSKHLTVLAKAALVEERKVGREHYYHINPEPLHDAFEWLAHYEQFWDEKLASLKRQVESETDGEEQ